MFHFSVIVIKELLKALATFVGSFSFLSFTSKVGACSTECTFPVSFFIMFHVVRFCCKPTVVFLLSFFHNFPKDFTIFSIICFAVGSLLFLVKAYRHLLCLLDVFIPCVIQSYVSSLLLYLTGKLAWKMMKKEHRNELNI